MEQHSQQPDLPVGETPRPLTTGDGNNTWKTSKRRKGNEETGKNDKT